MINCICVGAGGFIGAVLRYLISQLPLGTTGGFPYKTLFINILGAFLIGLIAAYTLKGHPADPRFILFLKVGICGGFTTFSTFALESMDLMQRGSVATAVIYIVLSVLLCLAAVAGAEAVVK